MSYVEKTLLPDERVVFAGTLHWVVFVPGLVITAAGGLLSHFANFFVSSFLGPSFTEYTHYLTGAVSGLIVLTGIAFLTGAYLRQNNTELAITNHRIIAKYGFISRSTFEIMLSRITGANFDQTLLGRLLGYGTILVHGAGSDVSPFDRISDPQDFHKALIGVLESVSPQASAPPPQPLLQPTKK